MQRKPDLNGLHGSTQTEAAAQADRAALSPLAFVLKRKKKPHSQARLFVLNSTGRSSVCVCLSQEGWTRLLEAERPFALSGGLKELHQLLALHRTIRSGIFSVEENTGKVHSDCTALDSTTPPYTPNG
ncbi:hypothetical protein KUCAC02_003439 [Chaenocephalus aceratus]|uniref:Uncharacterized protein n=1 Tax=Chaenocephalus aceratus TaxID=36190 RepID=A0ACB9WKZ7_CHAAC|nr:hypothetical protein KUCAC02_003439 [Chaenocephalus aceratus]